MPSSCRYVATSQTCCYYCAWLLLFPGPAFRAALKMMRFLGNQRGSRPHVKRYGSFCCVNVAEVQANQLIFLCAQSDRPALTGCSHYHPRHHIICWPGRNISFFNKLCLDSLCLIRHPLQSPPSPSPSPSSSLGPSHPAKQFF